MVVQHPEVDVITVGAGWTGSIAAQQLTAAGLEVVTLEKGPARWTWPDFAHNHDELRFVHRHELMQNIERESWTWRPHRRAPSLPMRHYGPYFAGTGVGGAGVHWAGVWWRFLPSDFNYVTHHLDRYGPGIFPEGHSNQDWPVSFDDLEPHYTAVEYDIGVSGQTGNLGGQLLAGGNPFEGPRSRPFPLPPMSQNRAGYRFAEACEALGYHPTPAPSGILSEGYTGLSGQPRAGCLNCGFCSRYGCEVDAKASPLTDHLPLAFDSGRYELRTHCYVLDVALDSTGMATGVRYLGRDGREHFQPARTVLLCGFTLSNVRLLLLSTNDAHPDGIGNDRGQVGRNYTHQIRQQTSTALGVFEGERFNSFMGSGSTHIAIYEYNADNFDHTGLGFIGGAQIYAGGGEQAPIGSAAGIPAPDGDAMTAAGEPREWGADFKRRLRHWDSRIGIHMQGESPAYEFHRLDLDPNYKDFLGRPLLRLTWDFTENEHRLHRFMHERCLEIMERMEPDRATSFPDLEPFGLADYFSDHLQGGAIMGASPDDSVTNRYGQVWDTPNVFVMGAALFPQNAGANPTATVNALAYHTLAAMREQYATSPGVLMS